MSLLGLPRSLDARRLREQLDRRAHSLTVPERPVHWTWLHGPAARPDPEREPVDVEGAT